MIHGQDPPRWFVFMVGVVLALAVLAPLFL